jgi:hypothetical protein
MLIIINGTESQFSLCHHKKLLHPTDDQRQALGTHLSRPNGHIHGGRACMVARWGSQHDKKLTFDHWALDFFSHTRQTPFSPFSDTDIAAERAQPRALSARYFAGCLVLDSTTPNSRALPHQSSAKKRLKNIVKNSSSINFVFGIQAILSAAQQPLQSKLRGLPGRRGYRQGE